ncbi:zinc-binding dehydrogenase [Streptomyces sp. NPDC002587]
MLTATPDGKNLAALKDLVGRGDLAPVVDRTYPLPDVAAAIRYVEVEHPRAKVVVTV